MKFYKAAALALLTIPTGLCAAPRSDAEIQALAAASFAPLIEEYDVPGLVAGVTLGGRNYFYTAGPGLPRGRNARHRRHAV